jgi:hypothetical protein
MIILEKSSAKRAYLKESIFLNILAKNINLMKKILNERFSNEEILDQESGSLALDSFLRF